MPRAHPMLIREQIGRRHEQGEALEAIARDLGMSYSTVRALWRRYRDGGLDGLAPHYYKCGSRESDFPVTVQQVALGLRAQHPEWGAASILAYLKELCPDESLPTVRTLQRWFAAAGQERPHDGANLSQGV